MRLNEVKTGEIVKIKNILGGPKSRFFDMGLVPGTKVKVVKRAPLKDPIEIEIKGYLLSLRSEEAQYIEVEKNENINTSSSIDKRK
nr:FeoA family protein [Methanothermus fervidus]